MANAQETYGEEDVNVEELLNSHPTFNKAGRKDRNYVADEVDAYIDQLKRALANEHEQKEMLTSSYQDLRTKLDTLSQQYNDLQLSIDSNGTYDASADKRVLPEQKNGNADDLWGQPVVADQVTVSETVEPAVAEPVDAPSPVSAESNDEVTALREQVEELKQENEKLAKKARSTPRPLPSNNAAVQGNLSAQEIVKNLSDADKSTALLQHAASISESHLKNAHAQAEEILDRAEEEARALVSAERRKSAEAEDAYKANMHALNNVKGFFGKAIQSIDDFIVSHENSKSDALVEEHKKNNQDRDVDELDVIGLDSENSYED